MNNPIRALPFAALLATLALATSARAEGNPTPPQAAPATAKPADKQPVKGGAGGDAGAKPTGNGSMVVQEETTASEPEPPPPVGDEKLGIASIIHESVGDVTGCYEKRLDEQANLKGTLIVTFIIGSQGRVIGARSEGVPDDKLESCVANAVRKWKFDKPISGGKLKVRVPFRLAPPQ